MKLKSKTVVLIGSAGVLGREMQSALLERGLEVIAFPDRASLDVTDRASLDKAIASAAPGAVVNASTFNDVDGAEMDASRAESVNLCGAKNLAEACRAVGTTLLHVTTDHQFDGMAGRMIHEDDDPATTNAYGRTRSAGERGVIASGCSHLIVRSGWLFATHGDNLLRTALCHAQRGTILTLPADEWSRPVWARDLATMSVALLLKGTRGVVNVANSGDCTPYEFVRAVVEMTGRTCHVEATRGHGLPGRARRPAFGVLDLSRLTETLGLPRHWRDALASCLHEIAEGEGVEQLAVSAVLEA